MSVDGQRLVDVAHRVGGDCRDVASDDEAVADVAVELANTDEGLRNVVQGLGDVSQRLSDNRLEQMTCVQQVRLPRQTKIIAFIRPTEMRFWSSVELADGSTSTRDRVRFALRGSRALRCPGSDEWFGSSWRSP